MSHASQHMQVNTRARHSLPQSRNVTRGRVPQAAFSPFHILRNDWSRPRRVATSSRGRAVRRLTALGKRLLQLFAKPARHQQSSTWDPNFKWSSACVPLTLCIQTYPKAVQLFWGHACAPTTRNRYLIRPGVVQGRYMRCYRSQRVGGAPTGVGDRVRARGGP